MPTIRMGGDYTPPVVRMVKTADGSTPEPGLEQSWTPLEKLRWHAALVEHETGVAVRVGRAEYSVGGTPQHGFFNISLSYTNGAWSSGPHSFRGAWDYLNGVSAGAEAVLRNQRASA
jgi:hypothetical protein